MRVLDPVAWDNRSRALSRRHLVGFTGLPPDDAGARTVCGQRIPHERLRDPAAGRGACRVCEQALARHGRDYYERQQRRWTAIARRSGLGKPGSGEDR